MTQDQAAAARAVTVAHTEHAALHQELMARIAPCFPRRESRATCAQMLAGLLMELEDKNWPKPPDGRSSTWTTATPTTPY